MSSHGMKSFFDKKSISLEEHTARYDCKCERTEIRRRIIKGGAIQYRHQCLKCGEAIGCAVAAGKVGRVADFDESLLEDFREARISDYNHVKNKSESDFWEHYNSYLQSPEWRRKREKVLQRSKGICEGCGDRPATQVHHTTYAHVGRELLFELVAICDQCHEICHDEKESEKDEEQAPF